MFFEYSVEFFTKAKIKKIFMVGNILMIIYVCLGRMS